MSEDDSIALSLVARDLHTAMISRLLNAMVSDLQGQPPKGLFEADMEIGSLQDELVVAVTECADSDQEEDALEILKAHAKSVVAHLDTAELHLHGYFLLAEFDAEERYGSRLRKASKNALEKKVVVEWLRLAAFWEFPAACD
jgi:hypothetical protein